MSNFEMTIWNRWGEMVFETQDPQKGWNGLQGSDGQPAPAGIYVVKVNFIGPRGAPFEYQTFATLIR